MTASNKNRENNNIFAKFKGGFLANREIGMLLLGVTVGKIIPSLPAPLDIINPYLWVVFLVVGLFLLVRGGD